jgi:hypothetical protein
MFAGICIGTTPSGPLVAMRALFLQNTSDLGFHKASKVVQKKARFGAGF